jgi:hypothetical protein
MWWIWMLLVFGGVGVGVCGLAACMLSSRISRAEEERERKQ